MLNSFVIMLAAIISIAAMEIVAIFHGFNGHILQISIATIGIIAGYGFKHLQMKGKK